MNQKAASKTKKKAPKKARAAAKKKPSGKAAKAFVHTADHLADHDNRLLAIENSLAKIVDVQGNFVNTIIDLDRNITRRIKSLEDRADRQLEDDNRDLNKAILLTERVETLEAGLIGDGVEVKQGDLGPAITWANDRIKALDGRQQVHKQEHQALQVRVANIEIDMREKSVRPDIDALYQEGENAIARIIALEAKDHDHRQHVKVTSIPGEYAKNIVADFEGTIRRLDVLEREAAEDHVKLDETVVGNVKAFKRIAALEENIASEGRRLEGLADWREGHVSYHSGIEEAYNKRLDVLEARLKGASFWVDDGGSPVVKVDKSTTEWLAALTRDIAAIHKRISEVDENQTRKRIEGDENVTGAAMILHDKALQKIGALENMRATFESVSFNYVKELHEKTMIGIGALSEQIAEVRRQIGEPSCTDLNVVTRLSELEKWRWTEQNGDGPKGGGSEMMRDHHTGKQVYRSEEDNPETGGGPGSETTFRRLDLLHADAVVLWGRLRAVEASHSDLLGVIDREQREQNKRLGEIEEATANLQPAMEKILKMRPMVEAIIAMKDTIEEAVANSGNILKAIKDDDGAEARLDKKIDAIEKRVDRLRVRSDDTIIPARGVGIVANVSEEDFKKVAEKVDLLEEMIVEGANAEAQSRRDQIGEVWERIGGIEKSLRDEGEPIKESDAMKLIAALNNRVGDLSSAHAIDVNHMGETDKNVNHAEQSINALETRLDKIVGDSIKMDKDLYSRLERVEKGSPFDNHTDRLDKLEDWKKKAVWPSVDWIHGLADQIRTLESKEPTAPIGYDALVNKAHDTEEQCGDVAQRVHDLETAFHETPRTIDDEAREKIADLQERVGGFMSKGLSDRILAGDERYNFLQGKIQNIDQKIKDIATIAVPANEEGEKQVEYLRGRINALGKHVDHGSHRLTNAVAEIKALQSSVGDLSSAHTIDVNHMGETDKNVNHAEQSVNAIETRLDRITGDTIKITKELNERVAALEDGIEPPNERLDAMIENVYRIKAGLVTEMGSSRLDILEQNRNELAGRLDALDKDRAIVNMKEEIRMLDNKVIAIRDHASGGWKELRDSIVAYDKTYQEFRRGTVDYHDPTWKMLVEKVETLHASIDALHEAGGGGVGNTEVDQLRSRVNALGTHTDKQDANLSRDIASNAEAIVNLISEVKELKTGLDKDGLPLDPGARRLVNLEATVSRLNRQINDDDGIFDNLQDVELEAKNNTEEIENLTQGASVHTLRIERLLKSQDETDGAIKELQAKRENPLLKLDDDHKNWVRRQMKEHSAWLTKLGNQIEETEFAKTMTDGEGNNMIDVLAAGQKELQEWSASLTRDDLVIKKWIDEQLLAINVSAIAEKKAVAEGLESLERCWQTLVSVKRGNKATHDRLELLAESVGMIEYLDTALQEVDDKGKPVMVDTAKLGTPLPWKEVDQAEEGFPIEKRRDEFKRRIKEHRETLLRELRLEDDDSLELAELHIDPAKPGSEQTVISEVKIDDDGKPVVMETKTIKVDVKGGEPEKRSAIYKALRSIGFNEVERRAQRFWGWSEGDDAANLRILIRKSWIRFLEQPEAEEFKAMRKNIGIEGTDDEDRKE